VPVGRGYGATVGSGFGRLHGRAGCTAWGMEDHATHAECNAIEEEEYGVRRRRIIVT